jgi:hypothetical protein
LANSLSVRRQAFGAVLLICIQSGLGMFVNLFVSIPGHHTGANPSNFFKGASQGVAWAVAHGAIALVLHTVLGLLLALMVIGIVAHALSLGRVLATWSILGALLAIGAGFNGASFLAYNKDVSSFIMTMLALASLLCFAIIVYLLPSPSPSPTRSQ